MNDGEPFSSVSRRIDWVGGVEEGCWARASATGSGASPSKNLAIAICDTVSMRFEAGMCHVAVLADLDVPLGPLQQCDCS